MIGFGWLGQAHSRSLLRIPTLFGDRDVRPRAGRLRRHRARRACDDAVASFGFARGDRRTGGASSTTRRVDVVVVAAPNMLHVELVEAAARPASTSSARSRSAARPSRPSAPSAPRGAPGVITGVGYNYRWAPLVRYAARADRDAASWARSRTTAAASSRCTAATRSALLSWRFLLDEGGHGVTTRPAQPRRRPRAHAARADHARGRHDRDVHPRAAARRCRAHGHYGRGAPGDPTGAVTNEDYAGMLCEFAERRARHRSRPAARSSGPRARWRSTSTARAGALGWNLEKLNELQLYRAHGRAAHRLHDGLRRRALPLPRPLRARAARTASASRTSW